MPCVEWLLARQERSDSELLGLHEQQQEQEPSLSLGRSNTVPNASAVDEVAVHTLCEPSGCIVYYSSLISKIDMQTLVRRRRRRRRRRTLATSYAII